MKFVKALSLVAALSLVTNVNAQIHNEVGDAGELVSTAQDAGTAGADLTNIIGNSGGSADNADMYAIQINDPVNFRATTDEINGGSADYDTQLFLFDGDGFGLLGNDDTFPSATSFHSTLLAAADDGTGQTIPGAGVYYLGVSSFGNDPVSAGGMIFDQLTFSETSGPDGPGGGSPLTGWDSTGGGNYNVLLTGTKGVPEPATLGLLGLGALALIRRRR